MLCRISKARGAAARHGASFSLTVAKLAAIETTATADNLGGGGVPPSAMPHIEFILVVDRFLFPVRIELKRPS